MTINLRFFKFILLVWLFGQFLLSSCAHRRDESVIGLSERSSQYASRISSQPVIKLNYYEVVPYLSKEGLLWDSFNLPVESHYKVIVSDLLLGFLSSSDNFISPPQKGSCKILQKIEKYGEKKKKVISFGSSKRNQSEDAGSIFLLLDDKDFSPYAIIKLNEHGRANCYLPNSQYHLSYNFGSARKDFLINTADITNVIKIDFSKKGILQVDPIKANNIHNGDLIRIGRKFKIQNRVLNLTSDFIPTKIDNDLFKSSNFQSQAMGVDEFLQSSILIGQTPFDIRLDLGHYVIAVMRKNSLVCIREIEVSENKTIHLECPKNRTADLENKIFSRNDFSLNFDTTFYPERLNQESHFQQWFLASHNIYMPIPNSSSKLDSNNNEEKFFSFLFYSAKNHDVRLFPENFKAIINDKNSLLPVFGTGFENIAQGLIPFSRMTSLQFQFPLEPNHILSNSFLKVSNGTEITVLEPFLSTDGVLSSMAGQRFRFRISVPSWNSTNVVEMYLDGRLHRRWILNRGDISKPFSVTLDEKTSQAKDFVVRFIAWGGEPLPNFIFGSTELIPFARTRDYFVTLEK